MVIWNLYLQPRLDFGAIFVHIRESIWTKFEGAIFKTVFFSLFFYIHHLLIIYAPCGLEYIFCLLTYFAAEMPINIKTAKGLGFSVSHKSYRGIWKRHDFHELIRTKFGGMIP